MVFAHLNDGSSPSDSINYISRAKLSKVKLKIGVLELEDKLRLGRRGSPCRASSSLATYTLIDNKYATNTIQLT